MKKQYNKNKLFNQREKIVKRFYTCRNMIRGSIFNAYKPCVYKKCKKCKSGEKHKQVYLSISTKEKRKIYYISERVKSVIINGIKKYNNLWELIEKLSKINIAIALERQTRKRGIKKEMNKK